MNNRNRKLFYTRPGSGNGFTLPLEDGTSRDVESDTDEQYISEQLRSGRKKRLEQEQTMQDRRYFYGQPAPQLSPMLISALRSAIEFFDQPVAKEIEGTGKGVRAKLFNHCDCPFHCSAAFRRVDKAKFLAHVSRHEEIQAVIEFQERARNDFESLTQRQAALVAEADKLRKRVRQFNGVVRRLEQLETAAVKRQIDLGQIDEREQAFVAGGDFYGDDSSVAVKQTTELRELREQLRDAEEKVRKEGNKLERLNVELRVIEGQIERFKHAPDTEDIAAGKAGDDVVARLLQDFNEYVDPRASPKPYKATYLPQTNKFVESTGGAKY